jgi:hypothetical protein
LSALRKIHGGLAHLFAILLPIQFFLAGLGAFTTIHNKKFNDNNFGPHGALGSLLGLIAILIVLLALAGRWSSWVTKLSAALFVAMLVQTILGVAGAGTAPILGGLHVVNALVVVAIAYLLVKSVRSPTLAGPDRVGETLVDAPQGPGSGAGFPDGPIGTPGGGPR